MLKLIVLTLVCLAIVNRNLQDDIKNKASEAVNQGEKLKVCTRTNGGWIEIFSIFLRIKSLMALMMVLQMQK